MTSTEIAHAPFQYAKQCNVFSKRYIVRNRFFFFLCLSLDIFHSITFKIDFWDKLKRKQDEGRKIRNSTMMPWRKCESVNEISYNFIKQVEVLMENQIHGNY